MLRAFAVVGAPRQAAAQVRSRFGGLVDRVQFAVNGDTARYAELLSELRDG